MQTLQEIERSVGRQVRAARVAAGLTQAQLAAKANVSVGAVQHVERGEGAALKTLAAVCIVLHLDEWFDELYAMPDISPLQLAKLRTPDRQRASQPRGSNVMGR